MSSSEVAWEFSVLPYPYRRSPKEDRGRTLENVVCLQICGFLCSRENAFVDRFGREGSKWRPRGAME